MITFRLILLRMTTFSDESCRENQNMHFMFNNLFFENQVFCDITWTNMGRAGRQATRDNISEVLPSRWGLSFAPVVTNRYMMRLLAPSTFCLSIFPQFEAACSQVSVPNFVLCGWGEIKTPCSLSWEVYQQQQVCQPVFIQGT